MECVAIVQPASVSVRVMWQLGMDLSYIPAGLEYKNIDQGIWMASLECWHDRLANCSFPYCMYGVEHCLAGREIENAR